MNERLQNGLDAEYTTHPMQLFPGEELGPRGDAERDQSRIPGIVRSQCIASRCPSSAGCAYVEPSLEDIQSR